MPSWNIIIEPFNFNYIIDITIEAVQSPYNHDYMPVGLLQPKLLTAASRVSLSFKLSCNGPSDKHVGQSVGNPFLQIFNINLWPSRHYHSTDVLHADIEDLWQGVFTFASHSE